MRRGARYIEAFRKWIKKYPDWEGINPSWLAKKSAERGEDPRQPKAHSFIAHVIGDLQKFRRTWGIDPTDPALPHSPFLRQQPIWIIDFGPATAASQSMPEVITLCIDVRGPMRDLLQYLEWRIRYEKQQHKVQSERQTRKHFEEYRRYLLVFDLRKAGMSRKGIAEKVFPEHGGDVEKMVSNYISKANRLIVEVQKGLW